MKRAGHFFILLIFAGSVTGCEGTIPTHIQFPGKDSVVIDGKFSMPSVSESPYLAIWVNPSLSTSYISDSIPTQRRPLRGGPGYNFLIKKMLLEKGIISFEYKSQRDSIVLAGSKYPSATMHTKAQDLEMAISLICSKKKLKKKKIILIGCSEGGASATIAASKERKIQGLVLIGTPGVKGSIFLDYQGKCADTLRCGTFGIPEFYNMVYSTVTFQEKFDNDLYGFSRFRDSCSFPLRKILNKNLESGINYTSNAQDVMQYINSKWEKEKSQKTDDLELSEILKDFNAYCQMFGAIQYIQPQQIELYTWNPDLYFPKITCPVIVVYGTKDRQLEYKSSMENIKRLLAEGGNQNFTELVFQNRDHILQHPHNRPPLEENDLEPVIDWISRL